MGYRIVALLGATLRWRMEGLEHLAAIEATQLADIDINNSFFHRLLSNH